MNAEGWHGLEGDELLAARKSQEAQQPLVEIRMRVFSLEPGAVEIQVEPLEGSALLMSSSRDKSMLFDRLSETLQPELRQALRLLSEG